MAGKAGINGRRMMKRRKRRANMIEHKPRLEGKVAIVTGAGSRGPGIGNGKATAILFAREGAKVMLIDRFPERVQETADIISSEGGEASVSTADVTKLEDCKIIIETVVERYGRLDILHNNVGVESKGTVVDMDLAEWDTVINVNLKSMVLTSRFAIPQMIKGGGGAIINISSLSALRPRGFTAYSAAKGGVISLTRAMAETHAKDNVRVNCIIPGAVFTPMVAESITNEIRERRILATPLQTEGTAWDVAWAAVYLASDEARWITGIGLPVDGGMLLTRQRYW
ncbi:MAG: SDR family NAD(P)-dependent oxidoreductase [Dehalococcoidales bacterium]